MNTPSHFLIGATVQRFSPRSLIRSAFLWGSVAPDIPLYVLTLGGWIYYVYIRGWEVRPAFEYMFDDLFFHNVVWIALHNVLHSPLVIAIGLALCWSYRNAAEGLRRWGFDFFLSCLLHTAIDIPTHVHDGPLLLFPLNWSWRFVSPISYWDSRYFGREFAIFELSLNVILLVILLTDIIRKRSERRRSLIAAKRESAN